MSTEPDDDLMLDERIKEYYDSRTLDTSKVDEILSITSLHRKRLNPPTQGKGWTRHARWFAWLMQPRMMWGAAICAALALSISVHEFGELNERTERLLQEAAMNHSIRLQLEYESADIDEIDRNMALLPFDVALPSIFDEGYSVVGARYCTLSGQLAAHVKLINLNTDRPISLFMTRAVAEFDSIQPTREGIDGVPVRLWSEEGLFYAMAGHQT